MLCGWSEIRELLNRLKLLYTVDTGECYGYAEAMFEQGYDDLSQIVNMSDEQLDTLTVKLGMKKMHAIKFVDYVRQRYGITQVCAVLQRGSPVMARVITPLHASPCISPSHAICLLRRRLAFPAKSRGRSRQNGTHFRG